MCTHQPQTQLQTLQRLVTPLVSIFHRVEFSLLLSPWEGAASCLLPVVPRLHQALQAPPWRARSAPLPGDRGQRGKCSVISVWYRAGCSEVCNLHTDSFERRYLFVSWVKKKMDLGLSGDVVLSYCLEEFQTVSHLCFGPQVYFQDTLT